MGKLVQKGYQCYLSKENLYMAKDGIRQPLELVRNSVYMRADVRAAEADIPAPVQEPMDHEQLQQDVAEPEENVKAYDILPDKCTCEAAKRALEGAGSINMWQHSYNACQVKVA